MDQTVTQRRNILLVACQSGQIKAYGYDPATQTLRVQFHRGATYDYAGVEATTFAKLEAAQSKGAYFHANIRDHYSYTRLDQETRAPRGEAANEDEIEDERLGL